jgi:acyl-CoA reductase-like NAD-dependent aldehyde dehydrogenase
MADYKLLIGGAWRESSVVRDIYSPYDRSSVGRVHWAEKSRVEEAIRAADSAFAETRKLSSFERGQILDRVTQGIKTRREELARSIALQAGKPIRDSRVEVDRAALTFEIARDESKRMNGEFIPLDLSPATKGRWGLVRRFPVGVVSAITPFNFPLNLVAHKVAPALASGNTVVLRPSSQVPITSVILGEIVMAAGCPPGALNVVPSNYEAAEIMLTDERVKKVTFTGSPAVGWELKKKAHRKKVTLELGGNAAVVIEPDADLEYALARTVTGAFAYAGQICISVQRIFLQETIYDRFIGDFVARTRKLKCGDPLSEDTDVGPMIDEEAAHKIERWIAEASEKGGRIACGGSRRGTMVEPTVLENVDPKLPISCLEAFAPIVVVFRYKDFGEALAAVNNSIYGLQAGVFPNDLKKAFLAFEQLDVGGVIINDIPTFRIDHMPYGGVKQSGFGREGVRYAIEEMTEPKLMAVHLA